MSMRCVRACVIVVAFAVVKNAVWCSWCSTRDD
jgi:hypothetical protein